MVSSSRAIIVPGLLRFSVIGEHTGSDHDLNIMVSFGGKPPGLEDPNHNRLPAVSFSNESLVRCHLVVKSPVRGHVSCPYWQEIDEVSSADETKGSADETKGSTDASLALLVFHSSQAEEAHGGKKDSYLRSRQTSVSAADSAEERRRRRLRSRLGQREEEACGFVEFDQADCCGCWRSKVGVERSGLGRQIRLAIGTWPVFGSCAADGVGRLEVFAVGINGGVRLERLVRRLRRVTEVELCRLEGQWLAGDGN
ncbi:hypothetical protein M5K25_014030 [Dendrobium thyrsiflorum]|uniref:Uncharacterized protein n=1 Tax=Dendrobium thyrsiflorum TaxID=117978 RepID=A0ABD0V1Q0_DENTH